MTKKTLADLTSSELSNLSFETKQLHIGQELSDKDTGSRAVPIYQTSAYVFPGFENAAARFNLTEGGNIYGRITNPTEEIFEKRIAALEGGSAALLLSSGAAAITYAILNIAKTGDHIVASEKIYGGTFNLLRHTLPSYGIETTFVNPDEERSFERALQPNTKAIFTETFGNPHGNVADFERLSELAHKNKIILIVDNTFASPYIFRPLENGADIVVESATKFIGGHGTTLGGVIIESGKFDYAASGKYPEMVEPTPSYHGISFWEALGKSGTAFIAKIRTLLLRDTGATISPFNAFLLLQGLETLSLRLDRHIENTLKVLDFLRTEEKVERVNHPSELNAPTHDLYKKHFPKGAVSIFTFDIKGGLDDAKKFINNLSLFSLVANVADAKSLVVHPATTTHSQCSEEELINADIRPSTIRLSIGIENVKDIIDDLKRGFGSI